MKVSLSMIVKDEIKLLERCLDSVEGLVDEIVIVDTGSTDGTLEIVKERADIYDQIEWNGFANARNYSMSLATGDLIFILDADEYISDHKGWKVALQMMKDGWDAVAVVVHNNLPDDQILSGDRIWQIRMFGNNRPEIEWSGSIHNQIAECLKVNPLDKKEAKFFQAQVVITHDGYNLGQEALTEKYSARIPALLKELEDAKGDPKLLAYYQYQTANAYFMTKDYEKAVSYIQATNLDDLTTENAYSTCLMGMHCAHTMNMTKEGVEYAHKMMAMNPDEAMSFLMVGLAYMVEKKFIAAYNYIGAALAQSQIPNMPYKYQLDAHYIAGAAGEAAFGLQRLEDAKNLFQMHLQKYQTPRIAQLEAGIIPLEQADSEGLLPVGRLTKEEESRQAKPEETVVIQDSRKPGLSPPSEENLVQTLDHI